MTKDARVEAASLLCSIGKLVEAPRHNLPEIAFAGRSNVGKSSVLTMLTGLRHLAPVSKTPGRTRRIGFYTVASPRVCFVDLPGYGYAELAPEMREKLGRLLGDYLMNREQLCGVVLLLDVRRETVSPDDLNLVRLVLRAGTALLPVLTKCDKLTAAKLRPAARAIAASLDIPVESLIPVSAHTGLGRRELWSQITGLLREMAAT